MISIPKITSLNKQNCSDFNFNVCNKIYVK